MGSYVRGGFDSTVVLLKDKLPSDLTAFEDPVSVAGFEVFEWD